MFFFKHILFYCVLLLTACTPPLDSEIQNSSLDSMNTEANNSVFTIEDNEERPSIDVDTAASEMLLLNPIDSTTLDTTTSQPEKTNAGKPSRNSDTSNNQAVNWHALIAKSSGNKY